MFLQDIFNEENVNKETHFHVRINENSKEFLHKMPPENLKEISFIFEMEDEILSADLTDILSNYRRKKVDVILEVPLHFLKSELEQSITEKRSLIKYILSIAHNLDVAVVFLPYNHPLTEGFYTKEFYNEIIKKVTEEMTSRTKYEKIVVPVSNYMEYLMTERIIGEDRAKNFKPKDKYIVDNFHNVMPVEESDALKEVIRNVLYDFYGGKDEFDLVCYEIIKAVYGKHLKTFKDIVHEDILKNQTPPEPEENKQ